MSQALPCAALLLCAALRKYGQLHLCEKEDIQNLQNAERVHNKECDKPQEMAVACSTPPGNAFPRDCPNNHEEKQPERNACVCCKLRECCGCGYHASEKKKAFIKLRFYRNRLGS